MITGKQLCILIAAVLAMAFSACSNDSQLKRLVQLMDKSCPFSAGESITMDKVAYDGHAVTINYFVKEGVLNFDQIRANEETFRANMLLGYANDTEVGFKKLMDAIVKAGAALNIVFNSESDGSVTLHFTSEELKANRPTSEGNPEMKLKINADNARLQTPAVVADGMVMTDVTLDSHYYTYVYSCDESIYDMDALMESISEMKEAIMEDVLGEDDMITKGMIGLLKDTGRGFAFKYVGTTSGKTVTVYVKPDEL